MIGADTAPRAGATSSCRQRRVHPRARTQRPAQLGRESRRHSAGAASGTSCSISGGDRHGIEPNANINLTNATSFTEFVHEIRYEGRSHVLFMPQYAEPWKHRILQSTLDAIRDYPGLSRGLAQLGRARLPSGRERRAAAAERAVARRQRRLVMTLTASRWCGCMGSSPVSAACAWPGTSRGELQLVLGE